MDVDQLTTYKPRQPLLSPLRYPGSKRRLVGFVAQTILLNHLKPKLLVEVFSGGASVALQLMQDGLVEKILLMDKDPLIANFWQAVFWDTTWLIEQIRTVEVSIEKWHEYKASKPSNPREYALMGFFLNRTSFSGILEEKAGPLGGHQQTSDYKIDCRFPRETLVKRIEQIAAHRDKVYGVWNCSWEEGLERVRKEQEAGELTREEIFFYFDPPFFEKAKKLYRYNFESKDHQNLRDCLLTLKYPWLLSYDSAKQLEVLYGHALENGTNGAKKHNVELLYSTGIMLGRKPTKEVIISNLQQLPSETRFWKLASDGKNGKVKENAQ